MRLPPDLTQYAIACQVLVIFNGFVGSLLEHPYGYAFFGLGSALYCCTSALLIAGARTLSKQPVAENYRHFVSLFIPVVLLSWLAYPVWWVLQYEGVVGEVSNAVASLVFDTVCKSLVGMLFWAWFGTQEAEMRSIDLEQLTTNATRRCGTKAEASKAWTRARSYNTQEEKRQQQPPLIGQPEPNDPDHTPQVSQIGTGASVSAAAVRASIPLRSPSVHSPIGPIRPALQHRR